MARHKVIADPQAALLAVGKSLDVLIDDVQPMGAKDGDVRRILNALQSARQIIARRYEVPPEIPADFMPEVDQ